MMKRLMRRLASDKRGAVAPTVALSLVALIACGGLAFDYAHMAALDTELQQAADQAALAAASQLDGQKDAVPRAKAAAQGLVKNTALLANDGLDRTVGVPNVWFFAAKSDAETCDPKVQTLDDASANFVCVEVQPRAANYALTPIAKLTTSGPMSAQAVAGVGSAICKTPPLMICNPKPGTPFDADLLRGVGVQVTGHGNDRNAVSPSSTVSAWAPGDFGFLSVGSGQNSDLVKALAFQSLPFECYSTTSGNVSTGNPQSLYDAINTRFDVYDFSSPGNGANPTPGNGPTLAACFSGSCPAAPNVVKDLVKTDTSTSGSSCKITNNNTGWTLPTNQFAPHLFSLGTGGLTTMATGTFDAMGLPRDNCHYTTFGKACGTYLAGSSNNRIGNGEWARGDYLAKYHPSGTPQPPNPTTITRYETYVWEINLGGTSRIPNAIAAGSAGNGNGNGNGNSTYKQYGVPVCSTGTPLSGIDRRVVSVAVVENCASLSGSSTPVTIGQWVDMFLVEPTVDARANGSLKDSIYMEVIGKTKGAGNATTAAQTVRRDVPYLIK